MTTATEAATTCAVNWAIAVQTYRESVDLYRRVISARVQRQARVRPLPAFRRPYVLPTIVQTNPERASDEALTPREREVARLIARGFTNQQIAETLVVTRGTVANHVAHILSKLHAANRTQIAAILVGGTSATLALG
jgi:DNA-binding NarL/FixJ family response regulator